MLIYLFPIIFFSFIAILYQRNILNPDNKFYALALFSLGIFSGLRFETGFDWQGYKNFFEGLSVNDYDGISQDYHFEPGYYFLNYLIKITGLSYYVVFLLASLFFFYALYQLTKHYSINKFYLAVTYLGPCFFYLNFGAVRQSLALGFFILGFNYYLCRQDKLKSLLICSIAMFFHISSFIYIAILAGIMLYEKFKPKLIFLIISSIIMILITTLIDFYSLSNLFPSLSHYFKKIDLYHSINNGYSAHVSLYLMYLLALMLYINRFKSSVNPKLKIIFQYALASIFISVLLGFIYSGSYAFYNRVYLSACIFQAYAMALIFSTNKGKLHTFVFVLSTAVSIFYYFRVLTLNEAYFLPYKTYIYAH